MLVGEGGEGEETLSRRLLAKAQSNNLPADSGMLNYIGGHIIEQSKLTPDILRATALMLRNTSSELQKQTSEYVRALGRSLQQQARDLEELADRQANLTEAALKIAAWRRMLQVNQFRPRPEDDNVLSLDF